MSLRILDLRGTPPPFEAVLPRPSDPGSDVHDAVAEILRQVRTEGDQASPLHGRVRRVDVSDGLRVPEADIEKAVRWGRPRPSGTPSRSPSTAS